MKRRFSIGPRLIFSVSILVSVVVASIAAVIYFSFRSSLDRQIESLADTAANLIREEIRAWLNPKDRTIVALRLEAQEIFPDMKVLQRFYQRHLKGDADFSDVYFFENKSNLQGGMIMTATGWVPPKDYDQFVRSWFTTTMATDSVTLSEPYLDAITGKIVVTVAQKVPGPNGVLGVVGADMYITKVGEIVASTKKISPSGLTALVTLDGRYLTNDSARKDTQSLALRREGLSPL